MGRTGCAALRDETSASCSLQIRDTTLLGEPCSQTWIIGVEMFPASSPAPWVMGQAESRAGDF